MRGAGWREKRALLATLPPRPRPSLLGPPSHALPHTLLLTFLKHSMHRDGRVRTSTIVPSTTAGSPPASSAASAASAVGGGGAAASASWGADGGGAGAVVDMCKGPCDAQARPGKASTQRAGGGAARPARRENDRQKWKALSSQPALSLFLSSPCVCLLRKLLSFRVCTSPLSRRSLFFTASAPYHSIHPIIIHLCYPPPPKKGTGPVNERAHSTPPLTGAGSGWRRRTRCSRRARSCGSSGWRSGRRR
jgi:hypothetical protein